MHKYRIRTIALIYILLSSIASAENQHDLFSDINYPDIVQGAENAPVTVVEYYSFICFKHCDKYRQEVYPTLKEKYIDTGKVKYIRRVVESSFLARPNKRKEVNAILIAGCSPAEKYDEVLSAFNKALLPENKDTWWIRGKEEKSLNILLSLFSQTTGLDKSEAIKCLKDMELRNNFLDAQQLAGTSFRVGGAPSVFVNGRQLNPRDTGYWSIEGEGILKQGTPPAGLKIIKKIDYDTSLDAIVNAIESHL